jgi:4-methyl-5(b-hydroxyethyl)-thiazole monophosphate biosynthesis
MRRVLIPLAEGFEELEAITLIDLLRRAKIEVVTASLQPGEVRASRCTRHLADVELDAVTEEKFDMIVLPGGLPGAEHLNADPRIHALLKRVAGEGGYTAAICAAPRVLADAGLLQGRSATSYPGFLTAQDAQLSEQAVVQDGKVITSRGPGTAMDFALYLIETLTDRATRDAVEAGLVRTEAQ